MTRKALLGYFERGSAHISLAKAAKDFPKTLMNERLEGVPFTPWALIEHIRIAQKDMVNFIRNSNYKELEWPKDYWPAANKKATRAMWNKTLMDYEKDLEKLRKIIKDPTNDLFAPIPHGTGQTIMKEVLQILDHASYHTGELVLMRRALHAWRS